MKKKILVIQQKMIGDVLITSVLCQNLKLAYPDAQVDYLIYDTTKPVVEGLDFIDNLVLFTKKERSSKRALLRFGMKLRKENYDIIIDCYAKLESIILVLLAAAKTSISYKKGYSHLIYTFSIERKNDYNSNLGLIIEQRLSLLEPINVPKKVIAPKIVVTETEKTFAEQLFEKHGIDCTKKTIMISIIGSEAKKTYPLEYMAAVIDSIATQTNASLLFNYIPNQENQAKKVFDLCLPKSQEKIHFKVIGQSIREFIAIMDRCDAIVGNDGGAINMAKALNKPSFIIFSPWIDKHGWATFEDGKQNVSVHLKDFKPELFDNVSDKEAKEKASELYHAFEPGLFEPMLKSFLQLNL